MPSAGPRPPHQDDLLLHHLRTFLGIIDAQAIDAVRGRVRWMQLAGGETLMRQGEPGDALYLLVSGRLRVYIEEDGVRRVVREVSRGEVVGEMSLITDAPRSATLVAIRDSVLVSLGKDDFAHLQSHSPQVTLALTRQIIARLRTEHDRAVMDRPVTMALMPVSAGIDTAAFAQSLAHELSAHGKVGVLDAAGVDAQLKALGLPSMAVDDERAQRSVAMLFDEFEGTHDYVLLVGDDAPTDWTHRCTRHADEILLLASAGSDPVVHANEQAFLVDRPPHAEAAEILVLMHDAGTAMPRGTSRWLARRPVNDHVHLRRLCGAGHQIRLVRCPVEAAAVGEVVLPWRAKALCQLSWRNRVWINDAIGRQKARPLAEQQNEATDARRALDAIDPLLEPDRDGVHFEGTVGHSCQRLAVAQDNSYIADLQVAHKPPTLKPCRRCEPNDARSGCNARNPGREPSLDVGQEHALRDVVGREKGCGGRRIVEIPQDDTSRVVHFEMQAGKEALVDIALVEFQAWKAILHPGFRPARDRVAPH